jgi:hypothetical protein
MRRLILTLALAVALAGAAFAATVVWGNAPQASADENAIVWGS